MQRITLFALLLAMLAACNKSNNTTDTPISTPEGALYKGTFRRLGTGNEVISAVSLAFTGNGWTGTSQIQKYPALCNGTYRGNEQELVFDNGCAWTAEFDWTLILSGSYRLSADGDSLVLSKTYGAGYSDVYRLKRQ